MFTDFSDFIGRLCLVVVVEFAMIHGLVMTTCYMTTFYNDYDFFRGFALQRNRYIRNVELVEVKSILLPPEVSGGF